MPSGHPSTLCLGFNSELAIVAVGATVGSLVGSLYFAPVAAVLAVVNRKKKWDLSMAKLVLLCAWIASVAAIAAAELAVAPEVMMFGTSLLVLSAISTAILAIARAAVRFDYFTYQSSDPVNVDAMVNIAAAVQLFYGSPQDGQADLRLVFLVMDKRRSHQNYAVQNFFFSPRCRLPHTL